MDPGARYPLSPDADAPRPRTVNIVTLFGAPPLGETPCCAARVTLARALGTSNPSAHIHEVFDGEPMRSHGATQLSHEPVDL